MPYIRMHIDAQSARAVLIGGADLRLIDLQGNVIADAERQTNPYVSWADAVILHEYVVATRTISGNPARRDIVVLDDKLNVLYQVDFAATGWLATDGNEYVATAGHIGQIGPHVSLMRLAGGVLILTRPPARVTQGVTSIALGAEHIALGMTNRIELYQRDLRGGPSFSSELPQRGGYYVSVDAADGLNFAAASTGTAIVSLERGVLKSRLELPLGVSIQTCARLGDKIYVGRAKDQRVPPVKPRITIFELNRETLAIEERSSVFLDFIPRDLQVVDGAVWALNEAGSVHEVA